MVRIDLDRLPQIRREIRSLVGRIRRTLHVERVLLFGSFATGHIHEGSDVDVLIVGPFHERFHLRAGRIWDLIDPERYIPVEPICYTPDEFAQLRHEGNPFLRHILRHAVEL